MTPQDPIRRAETEVIGNAVALAMRLQSFARSLERFVQAVRLVVAESEVAAERERRKEASDGRQNPV
jgi:class 3 adenylate cyclase